MMNRDQKKYAFERINLVAKEKGNIAKEKYRIEEKKLPDRERIDLIFKGKVSLLPRSEINDYTDLADSYDFSKYEVKGGFGPGYEKIVSLINETAQKAKDQIMLGDCEEALKLIKELENIKI